MGILEDIADATGMSVKAVKAEIGMMAVADAVTAIVFARFWPHVRVEQVAKAAGIGESDMRAALLRANEAYRRDMRAEQAERQAKRAGTPRKRHEPVGEPPTPQHRWCTRHDGWTHQDEMGRNSSRPSGYGDWCKSCWRAQFHANKKRKAAKA